MRAPTQRSPIVGLMAMMLAACLVVIAWQAGASPTDLSPNTPDGSTQKAVVVAKKGPKKKKKKKGEQTDASDASGVVDPAKDAALADRAKNRAFDGAPPMVPHEVDARSVAACTGCHSSGMNMGDRIAPMMSHAMLTNCTQCHVPQQGTSPTMTLPEALPFENNQWQGMASPTHGPRATEIAPPQIPHRTHMREQCLSCHGPLGREALRTSHPDRQNCQQCHTSAAQLDQREAVAPPVHP